MTSIQQDSLAQRAEGEQALFEQRGHIAVITLNRPARGNALSGTMAALLQTYYQEIKSNSAIRCTVITGAGDRHFSTGADVHEVSASGPIGGGFGPVTGEVRWIPRHNAALK